METEKGCELLQLVWNVSTAGYFLVDKNLVVLSASPAALSLCSQTEESIKGLPLSELFEASIDFSIVLSYMALALSGSTEEFSVEGVFTKGWLCLDIVLHPIESLGDSKLLVQFTDVTNKQQELSNMERLLNLSQEMVAVVSEDGYFKKVNTAWTTVLGLDCDDLTALPWNTFVHPDDLTRAELFIAHSFYCDTCESEKVRFQSEDECWHWLELRAILDRVNESLLIIARDITSDELLRQQLSISEKNYRTIFDSSTDMVVVHDAQSGQILDYNLRVYEKIKCNYDFFYSHEMLIFIHGKKVDLFSVLTLEGNARSHSFEAQCIRIKGDTFPVWIDSYVVEYNGRPSILSIIRDITEQKKYEEELVRLSVTDVLTSLENRRSFYNIADKELSRFKRYQTQFSVAMVDIDHFKEVNDTHGHDIGDMVLKNVSRVLKESLRNLDSVFRFGGEEFIMLLPSTGADQCRIVCERVREKVAQTETTLSNGDTICCTVSIGISSCLKEDISIDSIVKRADEALYYSKEEGRNRTTISYEHKDVFNDTQILQTAFSLVEEENG